MIFNKGIFVVFIDSNLYFLLKLLNVIKVVNKIVKGRDKGIKVRVE